MGISDSASRYRATIYREGPWWVIDVSEASGAKVGTTQARHIGEVDRMARDLVAAVKDIDIDGVQVDVQVEERS